MDDAEIDRIRKAIRCSFAASPHKKKYWLALLEMHVAVQKTGRSEAQTSSKGSIASLAVNSARKYS